MAVRFGLNQRLVKVLRSSSISRVQWPQKLNSPFGKELTCCSRHCPQKKPFQTEKLFIGLLLNHLQHLSCQHNIFNTHYCEYVAVWTRLELATPCVTGRYSNQLNYQTKIQIYLSRDPQQRVLQKLLLIQAVANIHRIFIFNQSLCLCDRQSRVLGITNWTTRPLHKCEGKYTTPFYYHKLIL